MDLRKARSELVILALILAVGAALRLYGLNWDGGHWLHPDERQIYFVTMDLGWPHSLAEALSPDSPLNPGSFAYGSLPFYLLKLVTVLLAPLWPALRDPDNLHLVGRPLAVLFDLGTVYLTFRLACTLYLPPRLARTLDPPSCKRSGLRRTALLAAALVSLAVLHVQLARFYTTDPLLTFFVMLTLNLAAGVARGDGRCRQVMLGIALGLALATKITAALLVVPILAAYFTRGSANGTDRTGDKGQRTEDEAQFRVSKATLLAAVRGVILTLALAAVVFVVVQPYAVIDWRTFLGDTIQESQIAWGKLDVPYTRQYAGTLPYLYSMWQTALWGLALPLGLVAWVAFVAALIRWLRRGLWADTLLLAWAGPYLVITGLLYTRYLRYMLPLVPILCLLTVRLLATPRQRRLAVIASWSLVLVSLAYAGAFVSLYAVPHSWITASQWIYREIPAGITLAVEDWDVALPLPLDMDGQSHRIEEYDLRTLPLYEEPDDAAKWEALAADLVDSNYLIIASRRVYGSIPRLPDRYPVATRYYEQLFAGELGFELAGEFTRGPDWLNPRLPPLPDAAPAFLRPDESLVVYDHPRVLIFRNVDHLSAGELLRLLQ
jgi:hypothetical protein